MGALVQPAELASFLQRDDLDLASAELVISLVEADVLDTAGRDAADCPIWVRGVVFSACARVYSNPAGNESETVGPFSQRLAASGALLNAAERTRLASLSGTGGVFAIDTTPDGLLSGHADICAVNFGATYCSCGAVLAGYPLYEDG